MYVEIFAKSDVNEESPGKRSWVNTGSEVPSISWEFTQPKHLGEPDWHVELKAENYRELASGLSGGELRSYNYSLTIHLTPADFMALVNFAANKNIHGPHDPTPQLSEPGSQPD